MAVKVLLSELVNLAIRADQYAHMRPVIEKEILHYDILYSLDQEGLLDGLTFQGGTALRLCYGLERYSEDLDFAGGKDFISNQLMEMKSCLEGYLSKRYGLTVFVKEPPQIRFDPAYSEVKVDKWQIVIITAPEKRDVPRQKIKLEVANIPAYTRHPLALRTHYDFLPDGYQDTLVLTESMDEILADKCISFVCSKNYIRNRDIWDLRWLKSKGAKVALELIERKISDYRVVDYLSKLDERILQLPGIISGRAFIDEIKRFIPLEVQARTINKEKFINYLVGEIRELLIEVKEMFS